MENGHYLSDSVIAFGAREILRDLLCKVMFLLDVWGNPYAEREITASSIDRMKHDYKEDTDILAFNVYDSNHHSLCCCFGLKDAVEYISSGISKTGSCPILLVHFDSLKTSSHYEIIRKRIVPFVKRYLIYAGKVHGKQFHFPEMPKRTEEQEKNSVHPIPEVAIRFATSLNVYKLEAVELQKNGYDCGWHVLRNLWLVADMYVTPFELGRLKVDTKPQPGAGMFHLRALQLHLQSDEKILPRLRAVTVNVTKHRIRYSLLQLDNSKERRNEYRLHKEVWNQVQPIYVKNARINTRSFGKKVLKSIRKKPRGKQKPIELRLRKEKRTGRHDKNVSSQSELKRLGEATTRFLQNHEALNSVYESAEIEKTLLICIFHSTDDQSCFGFI